MMKVLIVESEFLHQDTWVGNAVERLADALSQQNVTVIKSTSFDDGFAILSSNEAIDCLMFSYQIIESDIHKDWNLSMVASCLCLSPSLLKKKLKSENTSYSQIITTCRMRYAVNELMMDGKNISQVSQSCGYNSTSYFISVFKDFYGMTPLHYVSQHRERTVA